MRTLSMATLVGQLLALARHIGRSIRLDAPIARAGPGQFDGGLTVERGCRHATKLTAFMPEPGQYQATITLTGSSITGMPLFL